MRALIIGDVHLSDRPPSIRTDDYTDDIFAKLEYAVDKAKDESVDCIIQAGDLYHIKAPSRTSHELVQRTADLFNAPGVPPVLVVPGNHDMQHDRIESLPKQPLGTLGKTPNVTILMGQHPTLPVFGVPFLHSYQELLRPWLEKFKKAKADYAKLQFEEGTQAPTEHLLVTHAPIFPDGDEPPYDFITASDWASIQETGACYYGHIHDPHGEYTTGGVWFCNQGALSRGSLHEKTLARKPAVTLYDSDALGLFTRIEVPHRPIAQVFRMHEKESADQKQERVATFLEGIEKTELNGLSLEEVVAHAKSMDLGEETLKELVDCIEEVASR